MQNCNFAFLEEFKALDNICKELFDSNKGITTYIDEMKAVPMFEHGVIHDWSNDLSRLIKLRHVRNTLSHEIGTLNQNMCTQSDINWLKDFKARILNQTDPLALLHKHKIKNAKPSKTNKSSYAIQQTATPRLSRFAIMFYSAFALIIAILLIIVAVTSN